MVVTVLTENELRQSASVDLASLEAVESSFVCLSEGKVSMPPVMHIDVKESHGDIDAKGAHIQGLPRLAIKIASGFYNNPEQGLPSGSAMVVLLSARTGFPEAVLLDNGFLTNLRTGLAGAVAARHLAPEGATVAGIIGSGVQARFQSRCLKLVRDIQTLLIFGRNEDATEACARELAEELKITTRVVDSAEELVRESQIVVTTTPSREPLVQADWLHPGLHITAMGADLPGKNELEAAVLERADLVVCDSRSQCDVIGELQHLEGVSLPVAELGDVIRGIKAGRQTGEEVTICDLTGMGVQDVAISSLAYERALERGMGVPMG